MDIWYWIAKQHKSSNEFPLFQFYLLRCITIYLIYTLYFDISNKPQIFYMWYINQLIYFAYKIYLLYTFFLNKMLITILVYSIISIFLQIYFMYKIDVTLIYQYFLLPHLFKYISLIYQHINCIINFFYNYNTCEYITTKDFFFLL